MNLPKHDETGKENEKHKTIEKAGEGGEGEEEEEDFDDTPKNEPEHIKAVM